MIRGIDGVVLPHDLEIGRFYLDPGYGRGTTLFQWVQTAEMFEGSPKQLALVFASENRPVLALQDLGSDSPLLVLPPVYVRVDPPSATGTARSQSFSAGSFVVETGRAIVGAETGYRGWTPIDILTGRSVRPGHNWIALSRWSLVVEEAGEEIAIASFGDEPSNP